MQEFPNDSKMKIKTEKFKQQISLRGLHMIIIAKLENPEKEKRKEKPFNFL